MSGKTREQQLDELLDKQAIYELIMAYCNAADRHDHVKMRTLYHEDAIDDHGHFAKGLAMEFIDKLPEIQKAMEFLHHNVTTVNLKLAGDRAEGGHEHDRAAVPPAERRQHGHHEGAGSRTQHEHDGREVERGGHGPTLELPA